MSDEPVNCNVIHAVDDIPMSPLCWWCETPMQAMTWTTEQADWFITQIMCPGCLAAAPRPTHACGSELMALAYAVSAYHSPKSEGMKRLISDDLQTRYSAPADIPVKADL